MNTDDELSNRLLHTREKIEQACFRAMRPKNSVRLIAVTKSCSADIAQQLINLGVRDIGENRVQEIEEKAPRLVGDFTLHLIGHLQTNKAQKVWSKVGWIQSIDRERLVQRLESLGAGKEKKPALIEVNTTGEASKSGCDPNDCERLCDMVKESDALELMGLMTIGPLHGNEHEVRGAFAKLRELAQKCCEGVRNPELSMGMSGDFEWAIEEGATMVRIGAALVGSRK